MALPNNNLSDCGFDLSIIIPVFNEALNIFSLYNKLIQDLSLLNKSVEIIFINDGSTDNTGEILSEIRKQNPIVKIVTFRSNFGKSLALNAGVIYSSGEVIITMDGDLQDDSGEISKFLEKLNTGFDLVSGWKYPRLDPITKTIPSRIFNFLTAKLTRVNIHDFNCGFKAYRRDIFNSLPLYGEMHRYTPALAAYSGYRIGEIQVRHHPRNAGKSKYGFSRIFKGSFDLITVLFMTRYSTRPLHAFGIPGFIALTIGFFIGLYLVLIHYLFDEIIGERPLLLLSILLILLGLQFFSIGLIGEMLVYQSVDRVPIDRYVLKKEL